MLPWLVDPFQNVLAVRDYAENYGHTETQRRTQEILDRQRNNMNNHVLEARDLHNSQPVWYLRILRSFVRKHALDRTGFTPVEIQDLYKLYSFLLTDLGKHKLFSGILALINVPETTLDPEERLIIATIEIQAPKVVDELVEKIERIQKRVTTVRDAHENIEDYLRMIRDILIRYHTQEREDAENNFRQCQKYGKSFFRICPNI